MKRKKIVIVPVLVLVVFLIYWGYERWPSQKWREYRSLVRLWPRLQKEKIKSISFFVAANPDIGKNDVVFEVPEENLQECIKLFDKAFENVKPVSSPWQTIRGFIPVSPSSKVRIVTDKGKYIFPVETDISGVSRGHVHGREWLSFELGEYLYNIGFPCKEYKYELPAKEQTLAILMSPRRKFIYPPIAVFGDIKLAEKVIDIDKKAAEHIAGGPLVLI